MSAPYNCYHDDRVTMCVGVLIQSFLFKLDELDICKPPCPIQWQGIWASEAKSGSEQKDQDFEEDHYPLIEAGSIQL